MIEPPPSLSRFPLLPLAASFAAGIALGRYGPELNWPWGWFLALLALVLFNHRPAGRLPGWPGRVSLWLLFCLAGLLRYTSLPAPDIPNSLLPLLDSGQEVVISGHLARPPAFSGPRGKILLAADQHWQPDGTITDLELPLLLSMPFPPPAALAPGDRLLLRATLHQPAPPGNPGTFDYRQFLADQGIHLTGFLRSPANLSTIHDPHLPPAGTLAGWSFRAQRWRQQVNRFIANTALPPTEIGLYQALLTGDRGLLPRAVLDVFKTSGTFHLLAISGMHLGLLALLSGLLINLLLRQSTTLLNHFSARKITAALVVLLLTVYAILAGLQPPVVRALIMAAALIGALLLDRPASAANSLGLAALATLAWQPTGLFHPSFQLSYLAVGGILTMSHAFPGLLKAAPANSNPAVILGHWLRSGLAASTAAVLAIAPLTAFHFGQLTLLSPVSTLLVAPFLCFWALPLGLAGVLLATISPPFATILLHTGALGLTAAHRLAAGLANLPLASWQTPPPHLLLLPLYYLLLATMLLDWRRRRFRLTAIPLLVLASGLTVFYAAGANRDYPTRVTFLDVGQGAATLLELADGGTILVDGGSSGTGDFDLGEQVIAPFLRFRGLSRLDALIISHDHADHYNGLPYIIKHFRPRTVWLNRSAGLSPGLAQIQALAEAAGSLIRVPSQGEILLAAPTAQLICLSQFHQRTESAGSENSQSLVLELRSGEHRIILPGDIMEKEGELLQQAGLAGKYSVLLAPHHGSDNSASLPLAQASRPDWLIVSAGASSRNHFPGPDLLAWCATNRTRVHNTGAEGAISFSLGPAEISWEKMSAKAGAGERLGSF